MRARLAVSDKRGVNRRGILPFVAGSLQFSTNVDGDGDMSVEALTSDIDALGAWDSTITVELETQPGVWTPGPAYGMRHRYTHRAGSRRFALSGVELLRQWSEETLVLPEQVAGVVYRSAGQERYVGWQASAYDHTSDPREPWALCVDTGRTTKPKGWPTGAAAAKWITAANFTTDTESKYFRAWLTVPGTGRRRVRFYLSSDQTSKLFVAGELALELDIDEGEWKNTYARRTMSLFPGTYAVAIWNDSKISKGGDGIDPTLFAAALLDAAGDVEQWLLLSDDAQFRACRRNDEASLLPNRFPPGPTPGQVVRALVDEAAARQVTGWPSISTFGFTATHDSNGQLWQPVTERVLAVGSTLWELWQALAESDECDVWLDHGTLTLHAAAKRGRARPLTWTEEHFHEFRTAGTPGAGTWALAESRSGWVQEQIAGAVRREFKLTVGEAASRAVASLVAVSALRDHWRWDAVGQLNPPQPGWVPFVDVQPGDWMQVQYQGVARDLCVQGISARAGEGGLLCEVTFTEYPPDGQVRTIDGRALNPTRPDTRVWGEH